MLYVTSDVLMVRSELTAEASLAAMRARSKFGMAIAAMIRIIATFVSASNFVSSSPFQKSFGLSGPNWRYVRHFIGQSRKLPLGAARLRAGALFSIRLGPVCRLRLVYHAGPGTICVRFLFCH